MKTRDEADAESVKPFPFEPALLALWRILEANQRVVIAKSRQIMASWLLCVYAVWYARFHAHKYVIWQTQVYEDAVKMISMPGDGGGYLGRCQFVERALPSWLQQDVREAKGELIYPNGSMIEALAGGKDKVRGKTPSLIIEDEFAYQPEALGVYETVAPLIQKATKFVAVSTPNGPSGIFSDLYHGYALSSQRAT